MDDFRWLNPSHPQPLQTAVMLAYINSVFTLLNLNFLGVVSSLGLPIVFLAAAGQAAGGIGTANEKKWGYRLAIASCGVLVLARLLVVLRVGINFSIIGLMFAGALFALLLHKQSRDYQKIWFR